MTDNIAIVRWPKLNALVSLLGCCNDMQPKSQENWPNEILLTPFKYRQLERQAVKLQGLQRVLFVDGEEQAVKDLVEKLEIQELHKFFNAIFDGHLRNDFFRS